jgi:hypothetical protein
LGGSKKENFAFGLASKSFRLLIFMLNFSTLELKQFNSNNVTGCQPVSLTKIRSLKNIQIDQSLPLDARCERCCVLGV